MTNQFGPLSHTMRALEAKRLRELYRFNRMPDQSNLVQEISPSSARETATTSTTQQMAAILKARAKTSTAAVHGDQNYDVLRNNNYNGPRSLKITPVYHPGQTGFNNARAKTKFSDQPVGSPEEYKVQARCESNDDIDPNLHGPTKTEYDSSDSELQFNYCGLGLTAKDDAQMPTENRDWRTAVASQGNPVTSLSPASSVMNSLGSASLMSSYVSASSVATSLNTACVMTSHGSVGIMTGLGPASLMTGLGSMSGLGYVSLMTGARPAVGVMDRPTSACQSADTDLKPLEPELVPDLQTLARFDDDPSLQLAQPSLDLDFTSIDSLDDDHAKDASEVTVTGLMQSYVPQTFKYNYRSNFEGRRAWQPMVVETSNDLVDLDADLIAEPSILPTAAAPKASRKRKKEEADMKTEDRSGGSGSPIPLKKRPRMYQLAYPIGHGINKQAIPVLTFTFEEEFIVMDYVVRIEEYQNRRFEFLLKNFRHYKELLVSYVECTKLDCKIPFSKGIEKHLFRLGLEFTKSNIHKIFKEMGVLSSEVRKTVLNSSYPALYVVFFSILEGNSSEATWLEQHKKTIHITEHHIDILKEQLMGFQHVRSINLKVSVFDTLFTLVLKGKRCFRSSRYYSLELQIFLQIFETHVMIITFHNKLVDYVL